MLWMRVSPAMAGGVQAIRTDAMSVHVSNQSSVTNLTTGMVSCNEVENVSTIIDWSSIVIEPDEDEDEEESPDEKGIPDEKPMNKNAMFVLLGLKIEADDNGMKLGPIIVPTAAYDLNDTKEVAVLVDDKAPEEPLIASDERHRKMDIGTHYHDMDAFRKAIKQFAINGEFEYGTKKMSQRGFGLFVKMDNSMSTRIDRDNVSVDDDDSRLEDVDISSSVDEISDNDNSIFDVGGSEADNIDIDGENNNMNAVDEPNSENTSDVCLLFLTCLTPIE
ncbi:hypothetical protein ACQ4PT_037419 [Festuca glaucescens]